MIIRDARPADLPVVRRLIGQLADVPDEAEFRTRFERVSAVLSGTSPCGRTNMRIKGWMGRADQRTKVRGMFVDPEQVAEISKKHPGLGRLRLVIDWVNQADIMTLKVEATAPSADLEKAMEGTIRTVCKVGGKVEFAQPGSLPNDGKVIDDVRKYT